MRLIDDEAILSKNNVSVSDAATYLGWSEANVRAALRESRAPFGVAFHADRHWVYKISPGGLVEYRRHGVPISFEALFKTMQAAVLDAIQAPRREGTA